MIDSVDLRMGGTAKAALDVCAALVDDGGDVLLVSTTSAADDMTHLSGEYAHVPSRVFERRFPTHNFRSPSLRRWLEANVPSFDLVEIHGLFSFVPVYAAGACRRSGVPYTLRPHGSLDPFDLRKHALAKRLLGPWLFGQVLKNAAAVILTSQTEGDRLVSFGADPPKVVVPLPVLPPRRTGDGAAFRRAHQIPADALVVLFVGRIHPKKGLQFLIPSLLALKGRFPELWLVVAGTGEPRHVDEVEGLLRRHDLQPWVTRCDFLTGEAKESAFAASDVFALPSLNENFGIVVVEAMYAGLPVLVSSEVYIGDVVLAEEVGAVCQPTTSSCHSVLEQLLSDRERLRRMGVRGPHAARRHFAPAHVVRPLVRVYQDVIAATAGPLDLEVDGKQK